MRDEGPKDRPPALRAASMLEVGKYTNGTASAVSGSCFDAATPWQTVRTAQLAVATLWVCLRDIVNLKTGRRIAAPPFKQRRMALMSRFEPRSRTCPAG